MADEKEPKLGPGVTYLGNDEEDKTPVSIGGIRFKPGESVNLEERLGKEGAAAQLKALAGNRFFKVDGGPDHKATADARAKAEQKDTEDEQKEREEEAKAATEGQLEKPISKGKKQPGSPTFE